MVAAMTKISEPEQASLPPDGFYATRLKGAVVMSSHFTNSKATRIGRPPQHDRDRKRQELKDIVSRLGPKAREREIRDEAARVGFGIVTHSMLKWVRANLWPEQKKRKQMNFAKLLISEQPDAKFLECPKCKSTDLRIICKRERDQRLFRFRKCKSCGERFWADDTGKAERVAQERQKHIRRQWSEIATEKECTVCGLVKPVTEFGRIDDGLYRSGCKKCLGDQRAERQLITTIQAYGLSLAEYQQLLADQDGKCKICGQENSNHGGKECRRPLVVDHCHKTNKFRGLICQTCNRGIGLLGDSVESLAKAVAYLREFEDKNGRLT